ncbi:hypothetical protein WMO40_08225 [Bacillaceae bacterium CLA-AA-H227]|uniref:Uncharacterized protein n=1 Tax=Robertmurraya yapensis (ex Hitch et al 2024) TaxID=3133160 RepID=A0ACC6S9J9_9BACI|nr:hypothetical protein [Bacillus yapensis]
MKLEKNNQKQRKIQGKYRKMKNGPEKQESNSKLELLFVGVFLFFIILLDAMDKI